MRSKFSQLITDAAKKDENFLVLSGDHGYTLFDEIRRSTPEQFLNIGVAEQLLVSLAAGLTTQGFRPLVYGLASFIPMRVLEQIKLDVCFSKAPVILIGDGAGLVYSTLGVSHQCGEDIGVLRTLPYVQIYSPCDAFEMDACFNAAMDSNLPAYLRIGKADRPPVHEKPLRTLWPSLVTEDFGKDTALVATGSMVSIAQTIAAKKHVNCYSVPQLKPFPEEFLNPLLRFKKLICIDEHSRSGGLTSTLLDVSSRFSSPIGKIESLSLQEKFTENCGDYQYALSEHLLSDPMVEKRVGELLGY